MSELIIAGILVDILPVQSGISKSSGKEWKSQDFVVEQGGQYPKNASFTLFGDKVSYIEKFELGDELTVKFSVESRKFNDRYFTNLQAYSVIKLVNSMPQEHQSVQESESSVIQASSVKQQIMEQKANEPEPEEDDLPF